MSPIVEVATGISIPLLIYAIKQLLDVRARRKSVAQAIYGDLESILGYVKAHQQRVSHWVSRGTPVSARAMRFLELRSALETEGIVREASLLSPEVSRKVTSFYQHLAQYNIILANVADNWETRNIDDLKYQAENLDRLEFHLSAASSSIFRQYIG